MVKAHGGELAYEAPPEGGAEFRISLPAYRAPAGQPASEQQRPEARPSLRRILVVDDDPAVHRMVSALFTPQGAVVEAVRSGTQGIRMLKERIAKIPNVLADPAPDVDVLQFTSAGPVLCVRPYCSNAHYWQVYFDANRAIREAFGEAGYPAPMPTYALRGTPGA